MTIPQNKRIIDIKKSFYEMPYESVEHLKGKLNNEDVRNYYVRHVEAIESQIDRNQPLEVQAKQAFELRNEARTVVRELMSDKQEADKLNQKYANMTWKEILERKADKGLDGNDILRDIIRSSIESNESVNKEFGIRKGGAK